MKNYSRQREAILQVLRETPDHPTAATVFERVRKRLPHIGLGTVYRNLSQLSEAGEILCLPSEDGAERFDATVRSHLHLLCQKCHRIVDLPLDADPFTATAEQSGFAADHSLYMIYGLCPECRANDINSKHHGGYEK